MNSNDLFTTTKERSGSINLNRTDYQRNWSLCHLLELHASGNDYAIIFEHDEDIITLDKELGFEKVHFYQIKTKDDGAPWTLSKLLSKKKGVSFLGKLYKNKLKYQEKTGSLNFVSNEKFKVDLEIKGPSSNYLDICVAKCSKKLISDLKDKISQEIGCNKDDIEHDLIFLKFSDLALHDSSVHTKGKVLDFMQKNNISKKIDPEIVYKVLFDEIKIKSGHEHMSESLTDLLKNKGITKSYFISNILNVLDQNNGSDFMENAWPLAKSILTNQGVLSAEILKIGKCWSAYDVSKMDMSNNLTREMSSNIINIITRPDLIDLAKKDLLVEFLEKVSIDFFQSDFGENYKEMYNKEYVKAAALREYYEQELSETSKEYNKKSL